MESDHNLQPIPDAPSFHPVPLADHPAHDLEMTAGSDDGEGGVEPSAFRSEPAALGQLPYAYTPRWYQGQLKRLKTIRQEGKHAQLSAIDHFHFALWIQHRHETGDKITPYLVGQYRVALSGLGYLAGEQRQFVLDLGLECPDTPGRRPSSRFYPECLPRQWVERLNAIGLQEHQSLTRRRQLIRLFAVYWHSRRVDRIHGEHTQRWLGWWLGLRPGGEEVVSDLIAILERYNLLRCTRHTHHGGPEADEPSETGTTSRFLVAYGAVKAPRGMVLLPPAGKKKAEGGDGGDKCTGFFETLLAQPAGLAAEIPAPLLEPRPDVKLGATSKQRWAQRHADARRRAERDPLPECYRIYRGAEAILDEELALLRRKRDELSLDREHLMARLAWHRGQGPDYRQHAALCRRLLGQAPLYEFRLGRTGRLCPVGAVNPLLCSRRPDRWGHDFWQAVGGPLYSVDMRAADLIVGALLSQDHALLADWAQQDLYANLMEGVPGATGLAPQTRRNVGKLWTIATSYGSGQPRLVELAATLLGLQTPSLTMQAAQEFQSQVRARYPAYRDWRSSCRDLGYRVVGGGLAWTLPNGLPLDLDLDRPWAAASHIVQATVRLVIALLVLRLEDEGFDPLFEIHDCVVTRRPIDVATATGLLLPILQTVCARVAGWRPCWNVTMPPVKVEVLLEADEDWLPVPLREVQDLLGLAA